jgi:hypothetical protein
MVHPWRSCSTKFLITPECFGGNFSFFPSFLRGLETKGCGETLADFSASGLTPQNLEIKS